MSVQTIMARASATPHPGEVGALAGLSTAVTKDDGSRRRAALVRRDLVAADIVGLVAASLAADAWTTEGATPTRTLLFGATLPAWILLASLHRLYEGEGSRASHDTLDDVPGIFRAVTLGCWLYFGTLWLVGAPPASTLEPFAFWAFAIVSLVVARAAARALCHRSAGFVQRAVLIGTGPPCPVVARKLLRHPEYGIDLIGFIDLAEHVRPSDLPPLPLLGAPADLPALARELEVDRVFVAGWPRFDGRTLDLVRSLQELGIQLDFVPHPSDVLTPAMRIYSLEGLPAISIPPPRSSRSAGAAKRALDFSLSLVALVILAPAFAAIALLIRLDSKGPAFFSQLRMGRGGKPFRMHKFRTMTLNADERKAELAHLNKHLWNGGDPRMFKIANDPRITRVGRFLRRSSLDELPQLIHVLKGEMSLVGPRPLILEEDRHVQGWARRRLEVKPGMTGLWQALGASAIPFEEMVNLDYLYATTWSPWTDLSLLLRTVPVVAKGGRELC
jgi:exopolysaccharide biosynthesis polyprenyl glycosylphosphotransferase